MELNEWIHKYVADDKMQDELNKWDLEIAENKGYEQGTKQRDMEIAKNMLESDMSVSEISKFTGLNKNEIEKLAKD